MFRTLLARSDELAALVAVLALLIFLGGRRFARPMVALGSDPDSLPLTDLIVGVKRQLRAADEQRLASGEEALFRIRSVDLEINYIIAKRSTLEGQAKFEVVAVNATDERSRERSQKITVHLDLLQDSTLHVGEALKPDVPPSKPPLPP